MKKTIILLLMVVLAFSLFADDAKVMPIGVIRAYLVPSYIFGSQEFDADGDKVDASTGDYKFMNLGLAVEYGVSDWITVAAQWTPGTNLYSDFADASTASADGAFELFAGAKLQFVGAKGLSRSDTIRFAIAPGVMIPMAFSYDAEEEATNYLTDLMVTPTDFNKAPANGAFGLGARIYADYIVNEMFFINLYAEYIKFLEKDAADDFTAEAVRIGSGGLITYDTVNYGYKLTTEVEFYFTKPLAEDLSLSAGLPVGYEIAPGVAYDDADPEDDPSYALSINPNVSLFVTSLPLPLEFEIAYRYPLIGQNTLAKNVLTAQIKAYMKF